MPTELQGLIYRPNAFEGSKKKHFTIASVGLIIPRWVRQCLSGLDMNSEVDNCLWSLCIWGLCSRSLHAGSLLLRTAEHHCTMVRHDKIDSTQWTRFWAYEVYEYDCGHGEAYDQWLCVRLMIPVIDSMRLTRFWMSGVNVIVGWITTLWAG